MDHLIVFKVNIITETRPNDSSYEDFDMNIKIIEACTFLYMFIITYTQTKVPEINYDDISP